MAHATRPEHDPERALLEACLAGREQEALLLIAQGRGLRHYCARLDTEPLSACGQSGLARAFEALLANAYFDPHESALAEAMNRAAAHGHAEVAAMAWRYGATLEYAAIEQALDHGHAQALLALLDMGAICRARSGPRREFPSALDHLFESCCSRGLDEPAAACALRGAAARHESLPLAKLVAKNGMQACARAWLSSGTALPEPAKPLWLQAFPALMISVSERDELSRAHPEAPGGRKARL